jgi:hypothetical protein
LHQVTVERKIPYGAVEILVAVDAEENTFLGFHTGIGRSGSLVFIEVARATLQELEKGSLDLHTLVTQRCIGMIFETSREAVHAPMPA